MWVLRSTHNLLNGLVFFTLGMLFGSVLIMIMISMTMLIMTMLIMTVIAMTMLTMVRSLQFSQIFPLLRRHQSGIRVTYACQILGARLQIQLTQQTVVTRTFHGLRHARVGIRDVAKLDALGRAS